MATVITNTDIGAFLGFSGSPLKLVAQEQLKGQSYIVVYGNNLNPSLNGLELYNKYNLAKTATPYGAALSSTNRFTVLAAPGIYVLDTNDILLDTPYIDIISLSGEADVVISSLVSNVPITVDTSDIRLRGFNVGSQAIHIKSSYADNYFENIIGGNNNFSNPLPNDVISGNFKNCVGGLYSFGDADSSQTVIYSTFESCIAENWSFGYLIAGSNLKNCTATANSFGYNEITGSTLTDCKATDFSFANNKGIDGSTLTNCIGGDHCFGYALSGTTYVINSTLIDCTASESSFSNYIENCVFRNCKARGQSFGTTSNLTIVSEIYTTTFTDCTASAYSFGVRNGADVTFTNCIAGIESFGADQANATYKNCKAGVNSFGAGTQGWSNLIAGGQFFNCVADENSFGTYFANGTYYYCVCNGLGGWIGGSQSGMGGYAAYTKGMNPAGPGTAIYCTDATNNPVNYGLGSTTNNI
jgi:hypothetical protein